MGPPLRSWNVTDRLPFALPGARPHYGPDRVVRVEHLDLHLRVVFATKTLHGEVTTRVRAFSSSRSSALRRRIPCAAT